MQACTTAEFEFTATGIERATYVRPVERLMPARKALKRSASKPMWTSLPNMLNSGFGYVYSMRFVDVWMQ